MNSNGHRLRAEALIASAESHLLATASILDELQGHLQGQYGLVEQLSQQLKETRAERRALRQRVVRITGQPTRIQRVRNRA